MKILKNKTYSNLLEEIEELKNETQELQELEDYVQNKLNEVRQEYASFVTETKMNFSIKRFILGKKMSGKTTFIKSILPKISGYYIIDFTGEYGCVNEKDRLLVDIRNKSYIPTILEKIEENKDKIIIIDSPELISNSIDWFMLNSRRYNFIITAQSKRAIGRWMDDIDFIYDFGTTDEFQINPNKNKIMFFNKGELQMTSPKIKEFK